MILTGLVIGLGLGWLIGFVHRGWIEEQEQRAKAKRAEKLNRDHFDGGAHYRL